MTFGTPPSPIPAHWRYSFQASGRSLASYDGDVTWDGLLLQPSAGFDTLAQFAAAFIPPGYQVVLTNGYLAAGDNGGALYKRSVGPAGPGKVQSADGSWWIISNNAVNPRMFGARGNNIVDDTLAVQNCVSFTQGTTSVMIVTPGTYKLTASINITGSLSMLGLNRSSCVFAWTSTTLLAFAVASDAAITVEKITFTAPVACTAGGTFRLRGSATHNSFSVFRDCTFANGFIQIQADIASDWTISNCYFSEYVSIAVFVSDTYSPDAGDSAIEGGCVLSTHIAGAVGIFQRSSGGLKIVGNKIIGGDYAYRLQATVGAVSTSDLLIVGNSIENQTVAGIYLERPSGSLTFFNVVFASNQVSGSPAGFLTDNNAGWLSKLNVSSNVMSPGAAGGSCIAIGAATSIYVGGNELTGNGGTSFGISIGVATTTGIIGPNQYSGLTTKISNGAPTSVFISPSATQTANQAVTCSTAYGTLFYGSAAVVFPQQYAIAPLVTTSVNAVVGGISSWPSAITASGFTLNVLSNTSGGAGNATWTASGAG